jgi:hypothetical protein
MSDVIELALAELQRADCNPCGADKDQTACCALSARYAPDFMSNQMGFGMDGLAASLK